MFKVDELTGVLPALISPLRSDGSVDEAAVTRLVGHVIEGGAGTICGAANVAPALVVRIYADFQRGDLVAARADQDMLHELVMVLRGGVFPAAIKAACHLQGICEPWCAAPVQPHDDQLEAKLRDRLKAWGLVL